MPRILEPNESQNKRNKIKTQNIIKYMLYKQKIGQQGWLMKNVTRVGNARILEKVKPERKFGRRILGRKYISLYREKRQRRSRWSLSQQGLHYDVARGEEFHCLGANDVFRFGGFGGEFIETFDRILELNISHVVTAVDG